MINPAIVADSSPLIALSVIGQLELLPQLYQRILAPPAVWHEITVEGRGLPGSDAIRQLNWIEIEAPEPHSLGPLLILVDRGEAEAIVLAQSIVGSTVFLDDAKARRIAERLGVPRIGTLGLLRRAKRAGLVSQIKPHVAQLREHGIYMRQTLIDTILRDVGEIE